MGSKAGKKRATQATPDPLRRMLLPMVAALASTRRELMAFVHNAGLRALDELFRAEAVQIAGPKGRHRAERTHHHWGTTSTALPLGGRRVHVRRPRVRSTAGGEVTLPSVEAFQQADALPERVVEQILLGVSTRGYAASLGEPPPEVETGGASKSSANRHFVARTQVLTREVLSRKLDSVDLAALMVDGIEIAGHTVAAALGVTAEGKKVPLGLWLGSTENAALCTSLVQDLIERGLRVEQPILCVVDGGKGIRKALADVFGDRAVFQRCQIHKKRNVLDHLAETRRPYVRRLMTEAYASGRVTTARRRLKALLGWLERNGEEGAAASLREGMEETLTVLRLELPPTLRRSLATTNSIENMLGTVRRVTRNVRRWRGGPMVRRWTAMGFRVAEGRFRRIKGFADLPVLVRALRGGAASVDVKEEAA